LSGFMPQAYLLQRGRHSRVGWEAGLCITHVQCAWTSDAC
jgi:hypothetical protein